MAQSKRYYLDWHIAEDSQGFDLNLASFHQVLDTYQQSSKGLAREVLHATIFMPRGDADSPNIIGSRVDYLHKMLGLQKDEDL